MAFSVIYDIQDIFNDPHYAARQAMVAVDDPDLGTAVVQNVIPKFSETPGSVDFLGAAKGAHNNEVYIDELGYSREQVESLKTNNVI